MNQKDSGQEIEIIFADGMSDDGTREIIEGHIRNNGNIQLIDNKTEKIRTQDLELTYHDAAQFYWGSKDTWLNIDKMHSNALGYPIPNWRVVDIDNMEDLKRAESIFKSLNFDV